MTREMTDRSSDESVPDGLQADVTYLSPQQFVTLATSRKKMIRADELGAEIRGLLDLETGRRYLIEAAQLAGA